MVWFIYPGEQCHQVSCVFNTVPTRWKKKTHRNKELEKNVGDDELKKGDSSKKGTKKSDKKKGTVFDKGTDGLAITSICYDSEEGVLYTSDQAGFVKQWQLAETLLPHYREVGSLAISY